MTDKNEMPSHHGVETSINRKYPNHTMKLLIERASCRNFSKRKIPQKVLKLILGAGIHAPTGGNLQPYSIIKIEDPKIKRKLAKMCSQNFIGEAPVDLLFCIDWHRLERWAKIEVAPFTATSSFRHFWISFQDTIICAQNICTAADAMGLGSVYVGTIMEYFRELGRMFGLPKGVFPVVLLCLGYPKTKLVPRRKLGVDIVMHDERYREIADGNLRNAFDAKFPLKIEMTDKRLKSIFDVCKRTRGKKFAKKCVEKIKGNGYIHPAQRYFGLHYNADGMPTGNDRFLKIMEEYGFNWFKKFRGVGSQKA